MGYFRYRLNGDGATDTSDAPQAVGASMDLDAFWLFSVLDDRRSEFKS